MPSCAFKSCKNHNRNIKNKGIILHHFPKDPVLREAWRKNCQRQDNINLNYATVCSQHFTKEDYERDLKAELLGLPPSKKLKPTAIPSPELPNFTDVSNDITFKIECVESLANKEAMILSEKRELKRLANEVVYAASLKKTCNKGVLANFDSDIKKLQKEIIWLKHKNDRMQTIIADLQTKNSNLVKKFAEFKTAYKSYDFKKQVKQEVTKVLATVFTRKQISILLKPRSQVHWKEEDFKRALILQSLSKKCYIYLRNTMKIPLPGLSTLKRHKPVMESSIQDELSKLYESIDHSEENGEDSETNSKNIEINSQDLTLTNS